MVEVSGSFDFSTRGSSSRVFQGSGGFHLRTTHLKKRINMAKTPSLLHNAPFSAWQYRHHSVFYQAAACFIAACIANGVIVRWLDYVISASEYMASPVTTMFQDSMEQIEALTITPTTVALAVCASAIHTVITTYGVGWCVKKIGASLRLCIAIYVACRVSFALVAFIVVALAKRLTSLAKGAIAYALDLHDKHVYLQRGLLNQARNHEEWTRHKACLDKGKAVALQTSVEATKSPRALAQLKQHIESLSAALAEENVAAIKFLLTSFVARNKSGIDAPGIHLSGDANTKQVVESYQAVVIKALEFVSDLSADEFPSSEKTAFFKKLKRAFGSTGLCLSGGGSLAMHHMGVVRALIKADLMPNVISGSSGGSIVAGLVATRTNQELLDDVLVIDISVRYIPKGIRWFPSIMDQLQSLLTTGSLVSCSDFERTTQYYYGEPLDAPDKTMHYTFEDAFLKTGRHVSITVSASDVTGHKGPKKLLLNHINTPHVLLWSAVAVSCSLPGIMNAKQLMARDHQGNVVPYDAMGEKWMDGSIQHDLPKETMASCFNVTNFIVSQVNPRLTPFISDDVDDPTYCGSLFHTLEGLILADISHATALLKVLGFDRFPSQEISGDVTLVPDLIFLERIGVKMITNPTVEDMDRYLLGGERSVWPKLAYISHLCAIEKCLDKCVSVDASPSDANVKQYVNWLHPASEDDISTAARRARLCAPVFNRTF